MEEIKFKYIRFKPSGKMYESGLEQTIVITEEQYKDNGIMFYVHEEIRKLRNKIDPNMLWCIGMEDDWFYDNRLQNFNFPIIMGIGEK